MIPRPAYREIIANRLRGNPVVLLIGARQCGKTTLAREVAASETAHFFDLESPPDRQRLQNPMLALEPLRGLVVIDEAQLQPDLFPVLRVLADRPEAPAKFLLLGSASPDLIRGSSESLAGRVAHVALHGFDLAEVGAETFRTLWWRGGFPRSFLAENDDASRAWRDDFILSFLERDLGRLGVEMSPESMRRFWTMSAHYHGQLWNASEIGRSLGEAHTTVKRRLDVLCSTFVMRQLPPWFENLGKRIVKSPKVYVRDSGLLHALMGVNSLAQLESHPKLGASWEGFALEEILRVTGERDAYFWRTHAGAELDLLVFINGRRYGFEFKYADAPKLTKSMLVSREDLRLERLFVVYPGTAGYALNEWAETVAIGQLRACVEALKQP